MKEPCMCGAEDCRYCYPNNFRNGRFIDPENDEPETDDDGGYEPDNDDYDPSDNRVDYISGNGERYY